MKLFPEIQGRAGAPDRSWTEPAEPDRAPGKEVDWSGGKDQVDDGGFWRRISNKLTSRRPKQTSEY